MRITKAVLRRLYLDLHTPFHKNFTKLIMIITAAASVTVLSSALYATPLQTKQDQNQHAADGISQKAEKRSGKREEDSFKASDEQDAPSQVKEGASLKKENSQRPGSKSPSDRKRGPGHKSRASLSCHCGGKCTAHRRQKGYCQRGCHCGAVSNSGEVSRMRRKPLRKPPAQYKRPPKGQAPAKPVPQKKAPDRKPPKNPPRGAAPTRMPVPR